MTLLHRRFDLGAQRLHARGGDLTDEHVAETIQHQARASASDSPYTSR